MAFYQIPTSVTVINSGLKGSIGISLTEMTTTSEPQLAAGSCVEIAGAFFLNTANMSVTGWSAISTAVTAYLAITPSGTAGSQILSAAWTSNAPVWSQSKQSWYSSAGSAIRVIGGCTKTNATTWSDKFLLQTLQEEQSRKLKLFTTASVGTNLTVGGTAIVGTNISTATLQTSGTASVGTNLTVGGTATIGSVLVSASYFKPQYGHTRKGSVHGTSVTAGTVLSDVGGVIPITNDEMCIFGCINYDNVTPKFFYPSYVKRTGAAELTFYGILYNVGTGQGANTFVVTSGTAIGNISLAW